ncbi:MAG: OsmC family protein [Pyrinomonadaceae bacterium]|nr:OsmC family protein [Pyrinomonadaceae bacterium]
MEAKHKAHTYKVDVTWTGNKGQGTASYRAYERAHEISAAGKSVIAGSSDPAFRGDKSRYNPEELLVAALSACHMLSYLHMCADAHVVVTQYVDKADAVMVETDGGGGHFTEVTLKPAVTITKDSDAALAKELHQEAHHLCFIANSVNFLVRVEPTTVIEDQAIEASA